MELFNQIGQAYEAKIHMPVVHSPVEFSTGPLVFQEEENTESKEVMKDEKYQYQLLKDQWMSTHEMTDAEFDADEDLQAFLHSKAWKKAEADRKTKEKEIAD
jgi:hypothetical protein